MHVTPAELRDADIPSATRGFNKDVVDDMLERAADTIETLQQRLAAAHRAASTGQVPATPSSSRAVSGDQPSEELIQRTLLLAQRAADDAVAEARSIARRLIEEADAESKARRAAAIQEATAAFETTQAELTTQVTHLTQQRDLLLQDVAALESFRDEYETRMNETIAQELDRLQRRNEGLELPSAPALQSIGMVAEEPTALLDHGFASAPTGNASDEWNPTIGSSDEAIEIVDAEIVDVADGVDSSDPFIDSLRAAVDENKASSHDLFSTANRAETRDLF